MATMATFLLVPLLVVVVVTMLLPLGDTTPQDCCPPVPCAADFSVYDYMTGLTTTYSGMVTLGCFGLLIGEGLVVALILLGFLVVCLLPYGKRLNLLGKIFKFSYSPQQHPVNV